MSNLCFECGHPAEHEHHPVPKSRGGTKTIWLCGECHAKAHHGHGNMASNTLVREGLKRAKQRGTLLGSARPGHWEGREHLRDWQKAAKASLMVRQDNAVKYYEHLLPEIKCRREAGESLDTITTWLNEQGFVTRRNLPYTAINLRRIVARYLGEEYLEKPKTFRLPRKTSA